MGKHLAPLRPGRLGREDPGQAPPGSREWRPLRPWPAGLRYEDGAAERVVDRTPLPLPVPPGAYGCSGLAAIESRFAEGEVDQRLNGNQRSP